MAIQWPGNGTTIGSSLGLTNQYTGLLDELRLSSAALPANWIATEYNNQSAPGSFFNIGTEEEQSGGASTYSLITVTVSVASNASSPQVNSVSASGGGSASATATDSTIITPAPSLTVSSTHSGSFPQGQTGVYTVTVANQSGSGPPPEP